LFAFVRTCNIPNGLLQNCCITSLQGILFLHDYFGWLQS
jgi:hypothetical protein